MEEIEIKLVYKNRGEIIAWLKQNGFTLIKSREIKDLYFVLNNNQMSAIDSFYRIRDVAGEFTELTLKDNFQEENGIKTRREINVKMEDPEKMATILISLGCSLLKEHFAKRDIWENGEVKFEFIDYSKPAELSLIEIEGPDKRTIQSILDSLGNKVEIAGDNLFAVFDNQIKH